MLKKISSFLLIFLLLKTSILILPINLIQSASAIDTLGWEQVNSDGFGTASNTKAGGVFEFNGKLYAPTNNTSGTQLWSSTDGSSGSWNRVTSLDFNGDTNNISLHSNVEFNNALYIPTRNSITGTEIWKTTDGNSWTQVNYDGFGTSAITPDPTNYKASGIGSLNGYLYFSSINANGAQVWRSSNPDDPASWEKVADFATGLGVDADAKNTQIMGMVSGGYLYFATIQEGTLLTGTEVWRTQNGTTWEQINADGFGDSENTGSTIKFFNGELFASTQNNSGSKIYRYSGSGTSWSYIDTAIDDDINNKFIRLGAGFIVNNTIYAGTQNSVTGAEVWKSTNGTDWTQINSDGFDDSGRQNNTTWTDLVYNGYLYAGTNNFTTGGEIWRLNVSPPTPSLINGSFEMDNDSNSIPDNWIPSNFAPGDGRSADYFKDGNYSLKIISTGKFKRLTQTIPIGGNIGDKFTLSGWNKNIGTTSGGLCIRAYIYLNNTDGTKTTASIPFLRGPHDWLKYSVNITANKNFSSIDILIGNVNQTGIAYFDDFRLVKN